jgi:hypothetical protein
MKKSAIKISLVFIFAVFLAHIKIKAQETEEKYEISTDRPSVSFSAGLAPKNIFILESGYFSQKQTFEDKSTNKFQTMPNLSLRYGLTDNIELRVGWDYRSSESSTTLPVVNTYFNEQGTSPLTLGTKIKMLENKGFVPQMTFLGAVQLPFSGNNSLLTSNHISNYFRFLFQNKLNDRFFLFYNAGADFGTNSLGEAQTTGAYTFALGANVVNGLSAFVELFGFMPEKDIDNHSIDTGLVYVINKQYQLDASIGYGLTKYAPDMFFNLGFSFYINTKSKK